MKANNTPAWVSDENLLKKQIYDLLKPYVSTGMPKKVSNFLEVLY